MDEKVMDNNYLEESIEDPEVDELSPSEEVEETEDDEFLENPEDSTLSAAKEEDSMSAEEETEKLDDLEPLKDSEETAEDSTHEIIKVAVDWIELEGALENNSPELHSFINTITGDVIRVFEEGEDSEERLKQAETSPNFVFVEPVSSREQYHWMEEFIEIVEEPTLKDKLNIAIDGKGAFRRFKDVLVAYPTERERWFGKRSVKLRAHMKAWLTSKHMEPTNIPPWEAASEETDETYQSRSTDEESRNKLSDAPSDLRATAHELIDLVPSRELPTAVAFLEFLRSRRGYRRSRFG